MFLFLQYISPIQGGGLLLSKRDSEYIFTLLYIFNSTRVIEKITLDETFLCGIMMVVIKASMEKECPEQP